MTLPSFLGIGAAKSGTTWLYELLKEHPQVYMPSKTKDIRFFDYNYEKGIDWYQGFFPSPEIAGNYKTLGEFSAHYIYSEEAPSRIARDLQHPKLLLMIRNPADRTYSLYLHEKRYKNYPGTFEQFLIDRPRVTRSGGAFTARHIKRYQQYFGQDQFFIGLFDRVFADVKKAREEFAEFLGLDPGLFDENAGIGKRNEGFLPRSNTLYSMIARSTWWLNQDMHVYWPTYLGKKLGLKRLLTLGGTRPPRMEVETRQMLLKVFDEEISALESVLQTDLSNWRT